MKKNEKKETEKTKTKMIEEGIEKRRKEVKKREEDIEKTQMSRVVTGRIATRKIKNTREGKIQQVIMKQKDKEIEMNEDVKNIEKKEVTIKKRERHEEMEKQTNIIEGGRKMNVVRRDINLPMIMTEMKE